MAATSVHISSCSRLPRKLRTAFVRSPPILKSAQFRWLGASKKWECKKVEEEDECQEDEGVTERKEERRKIFAGNASQLHLDQTDPNLDPMTNTSLQGTKIERVFVY